MFYSDTFTFHGYFLHLLLVNINLTSASNSNTIDNGNCKLKCIKKKSLFDLDKLKLLRYIDNNIIGKNFIINGPWGLRKSTIFDFSSNIYMSISKSFSDLCRLHSIRKTFTIY